MHSEVRPGPAELRDRAAAALVCPVCRGDLTWSWPSAECTACGSAYPGAGTIPVLVPEDARSDPYKQLQASSHDFTGDAEFEIARPGHTPAMHGWLLEQKFRRSCEGLEPLMSERPLALTVCGGSGMDAEFLARAGADVIASDISIGAAARAGERAARSRLAIVPIVADVERLPFRDRGVDLVYVHDGLHHLESPYAGLAEMARVARQAVSVTEPADAAGTAVAVRLGLALSVEDSGNRVGRLRLREATEELAGRGFDVIRPHRYVMYYRHHPGRVATFCSRQRILPVAKLAFGAANAVIGRFGNKLAVQAVRHER